MKDSEIRERLGKGWMRAIVTFEVVGKPAAHVTQALQKYLDNLKQDDRIVFLRTDSEPPAQVDDGLFSTFCEAELLVKNLETFTWLCFNFSPASIEILDPQHHDVEARDLQNWLNDLLAQLHEVGANYRSHKSANEHLTVAMNQLITNAILLSLRQGGRTDREIAGDTGIHKDQLDPFLEHLTKKGSVKKDKHVYVLPSPSAKVKK